MKKLLNEMIKVLVAVILCMACLWFVLSFAWSSDDMSTAEKIAGVVMFLCVGPMYEGLKRVMRLT